jgi:hypothetical protein
VASLIFTRYDRPSFASHLCPRRNFQGVGHDVGTRIKVNNFAAGVLQRLIRLETKLIKITNLVHDRVECLSIISFPVTFGALVLDADELINGVSLILRMTSLEDFASAINQALRFHGSWYGALGKLGLGVGARVNVALSPRVNGSIATSQDDRTIEDSDCRGDITELDIIENKRSSKCANGCI